MLYFIFNMDRKQGQFEISPWGQVTKEYMLYPLLQKVLADSYQGDVDFTASAYVEYDHTPQGKPEIYGVYIFALSRLGDNFLAPLEGDEMLSLFYGESFRGNLVHLAQHCRECGAIMPLCTCHDVGTEALDLLEQTLKSPSLADAAARLPLRMLAVMHRELELHRERGDLQEYVARLLSLISDLMDLYSSRVNRLAGSGLLFLWSLPLDRDNRMRLAEILARLLGHSYQWMDINTSLEDFLVFGIPQKTWVDIAPVWSGETDFAYRATHMLVDRLLRRGETVHVDLALHLFDHYYDTIISEIPTLVNDRGGECTWHDVLRARLQKEEPIGFMTISSILRALLSSRPWHPDTEELVRDLACHSPASFLFAFVVEDDNNLDPTVDNMRDLWEGHVVEMLGKKELQTLWGQTALIFSDWGQAAKQGLQLSFRVCLYSLVSRMYELGLADDDKFFQELCHVVDFVIHYFFGCRAKIAEFISELIYLPVYDHPVWGKRFLTFLLDTICAFTVDRLNVSTCLCYARDNDTIRDNKEAIALLWEYFPRHSVVRELLALVALWHGPDFIPPEAWRSLRRSKAKNIKETVEKILEQESQSEC